jgi:hypothetical protein
LDDVDPGAIEIPIIDLERIAIEIPILIVKMVNGPYHGLSVPITDVICIGIFHQFAGQHICVEFDLMGEQLTYTCSICYRLCSTCVMVDTRKKEGYGPEPDA